MAFLLYLLYALFPLGCIPPLFAQSSHEEPYLSNIRQLTFTSMGFEKAGEAYFSPDGKSIIFQAVPQGQKGYQIYILPLEEEASPRLVSTGQGTCTCGFFKPDGRKVLFASSHSAPSAKGRPIKCRGYAWELTPYMNIYEANLDGSDLCPLTFGPAYHAECAYSPDGKQIVYASNEEGDMHLYLMDADGSNKRRLTEYPACYHGGPFFSPNGTQIVFRADRQVPHYLQIYLIGIDGQAERQLTDNGSVNWAPFWHPGGKVIAYTTSLHGHHCYQIYLLHVETGKELRLTQSGSFEGLPSFNAEGTKMLWTSKREGGDCQVFIADFQMPIELRE